MYLSRVNPRFNLPQPHLPSPLVLQSQYGGLKSRAMGPGGMMHCPLRYAFCNDPPPPLRYDMSTAGSLLTPPFGIAEPVRRAQEPGDGPRRYDGRWRNPGGGGGGGGITARILPGES